MPKSKKPRKKYRANPAAIIENPVGAAIAAARVFTDQEATERIELITGAIDRACAGQASVNDWDAILFAWTTVDAMAGLPGIMTNGKQACDLVGETLLDIAKRDGDIHVTPLLPAECDTLRDFLALYTHLVLNVSLSHWAVAETKATTHRTNVKRSIINDDIEKAYA